MRQREGERGKEKCGEGEIEERVREREGREADVTWRFFERE